MNKVILVGRMTKDIEIKVIKGSKSKGTEDTPVANFTLAVDERRWDETAFVNCVAKGKLAEALDSYIKKGSPIMLWGRLRTRDYDDKNGIHRFVTEVKVEGFEFCPTNIPPENKEKKESKRYGRK